MFFPPTHLRNWPQSQIGFHLNRCKLKEKKSTPTLLGLHEFQLSLPETNSNFAPGKIPENWIVGIRGRLPFGPHLFLGAKWLLVSGFVFFTPMGAVSDLRKPIVWGSAIRLPEAMRFFCFWVDRALVTC